MSERSRTASGRRRGGASAVESVMRETAAASAGALQLPIGATRGRRAASEAAIDERWLRWIAQHRYVDARAIAARFAVTLQAVWRRLRRLTDAQLLARRSAGHVTVFYLSSRGARLLEIARRKPPTAPLASLEHDLAVARWHGQLERAVDEHDPGALVLSERGMRERHTAALPYCALARGEGGRIVKRWPDVAIERPSGLYAYELEFTAKAPRRLQAIVRAYRNDQARFRKVSFLVTSPALGRRLALLAVQQRAAAIAVEPWHELPEAAKQNIRDAVNAIRATLPAPLAA